MNKRSYFFPFLLLSVFRHGLVFLLSMIFGIIGLFGVVPCLYIGWGLLALFVILCAISTFNMVRMSRYRSEDNPEFNELMDALQTFEGTIGGIIEQQQENRNLHGEELLTLSDDDLYETVYFQVLELGDDPETGEYNPANLTEGQRIVYVLSTFEMEIGNGGLCQFFVNSSRVVAPLVADCLTAVGAHEHRTLYEDFVRENGLDLNDLSSFEVNSTRGFIKQTKRFDFDSFDDAFYTLPSLQGKVTAYIRANISQF